MSRSNTLTGDFIPRNAHVSPRQPSKRASEDLLEEIQKIDRQKVRALNEARRRGVLATPTARVKHPCVIEPISYPPCL